MVLRKKQYSYNKWEIFPTSDKKQAGTRTPYLHERFSSLFLSVAPLIFSTFCNIMYEQQQRKASNPF